LPSIEPRYNKRNKSFYNIVWKFLRQANLVRCEGGNKKFIDKLGHLIILYRELITSRGNFPRRHDQVILGSEKYAVSNTLL
jgi:hypothetical protein